MKLNKFCLPQYRDPFGGPPQRAIPESVTSSAAVCIPTLGDTLGYTLNDIYSGLPGRSQLSWQYANDILDFILPCDSIDITLNLCATFLVLNAFEVEDAEVSAAVATDTSNNHMHCSAWLVPW